MSRRGFAPIFIIIIITAAVVLGGVVLYYAKVLKKPAQVACTQEAKQCPDGSYVGRTGPNCEFAPCPAISTSTPTTTITTTVPPAVTIDTLTWKIYKNTKYGFKFSYPADHTPYVSVDAATSRLVPAASSSDSIIIAEKESDAILGKGNKFVAQIVNIDERISTWLDENLKNYLSNPTTATRKDITIAGKPAAEITALQPTADSSDTYRMYVIQPGNYLLVITENAPSALFDAIFSTLNFNPQ